MNPTSEGVWRSAVEHVDLDFLKKLYAPCLMTVSPRVDLSGVAPSSRVARVRGADRTKTCVTICAHLLGLPATRCTTPAALSRAHRRVGSALGHANTN